ARARPPGARVRAEPQRDEHADDGPVEPPGGEDDGPRRRGSPHPPGRDAPADHGAAEHGGDRPHGVLPPLTCEDVAARLLCAAARSRPVDNPGLLADQRAEGLLLSYTGATVLVQPRRDTA